MTDDSQTASLYAEFAAAMASLGPCGPQPRLAVAVSGGADSTALALLAQRWTAARDGEVFAVIIDHGLRPGSADEAALTQHRLAARQIAATIITLSGLGGAGLQARARAARHAALARAARAGGALFLLIGHHAADLAETVAMRARHGQHGLEGIPGWSGREDVVLLRPLLGIAPERLREFLRQQNMSWIEDPSNADPRFERVRVRLQGAARAPLPAAPRQTAEAVQAAYLARSAIIRPEGFALVPDESPPPGALAALLRIIGGSLYPPPRLAVIALAARMRPATLGGVRILPAGRLGAGWLLVREAAAIGAPVAARRGAIWDRRWRLLETVDDGICGALGARTALPRNGRLPAVVLRAMPFITAGDAAPRLAKAIFAPPSPAAPLWFQPGSDTKSA